MEQFKKVLITAVVLAVLIIAYFVSMVLKTKVEQKKALENQSQSSQQKPVSEQYINYDSSTKKVDQKSYTGLYRLVYDSDNTEDFPRDAKIVTNGSGTIIVPSVKTAYPTGNGELMQMSTSNNPNYLYLSENFGEGCGNIIRFDGTTKKFTKLKVSNLYDCGAARESEKSPYVASIINPNVSQKDGDTLYLLDLDKDSYKILTKLPSTQTFNPCSIDVCMGDTYATIEWIDATNFQIEIYSTKPGKDEQGQPKALLIEKRKFTIK